MFIEGYRLVNINHLAIIYIDRINNTIMGVFPNGNEVKVTQCKSAKDAEDKYYLLCETLKAQKNIISLDVNPIEKTSAPYYCSLDGWKTT